MKRFEKEEIVYLGGKTICSEVENVLRNKQESGIITRVMNGVGQSRT